MMKDITIKQLKPLQEILPWHSKESELERLLKSPFEVTLEDFPLMYVTNYEHKQVKKDKVKSLCLSPEHQEYALKAVGYDYTFGQKTAIAHCYHRFKREGISRSVLGDVKGLWHNIIAIAFHTSGANERIGKEKMAVIWPELNLGYQNMHDKYYELRARIKQSSEYPKIDKILHQEVSHFESLNHAFGNTLNTAQKCRDFGKDYSHLQISEKEWDSIVFRGMHDLPSGYSHLTSI